MCTSTDVWTGAHHPAAQPSPCDCAPATTGSAVPLTSQRQPSDHVPAPATKVWCGQQHPLTWVSARRSLRLDPRPAASQSTFYSTSRWHACTASPEALPGYPVAPTALAWALAGVPALYMLSPAPPNPHPQILRPHSTRAHRTPTRCQDQCSSVPTYSPAGMGWQLPQQPFYVRHLGTQPCSAPVPTEPYAPQQSTLRNPLWSLVPTHPLPP